MSATIRSLSGEVCGRPSIGVCRSDRIARSAVHSPLPAGRRAQGCTSARCRRCRGDRAAAQADSPVRGRRRRLLSSPPSSGRATDFCGQWPPRPWQPLVEVSLSRAQFAVAAARVPAGRPQHASPVRRKCAAAGVRRSGGPECRRRATRTWICSFRPVSAETARSTSCSDRSQRPAFAGVVPPQDVGTTVTELAGDRPSRGAPHRT